MRLRREEEEEEKASEELGRKLKEQSSKKSSVAVRLIDRLDRIEFRKEKREKNQSNVPYSLKNIDMENFLERFAEESHVREDMEKTFKVPKSNSEKNYSNPAAVRRAINFDLNNGNPLSVEYHVMYLDLFPQDMQKKVEEIAAQVKKLEKITDKQNSEDMEEAPAPPLYNGRMSGSQIKGQSSFGMINRPEKASSQLSSQPFKEHEFQNSSAKYIQELTSVELNSTIQSLQEKIRDLENKLEEADAKVFKTEKRASELSSEVGDHKDQLLKLTSVCLEA